MRIFKRYTYEWWEVAIFKLSLLLLGIAIGVYWEPAFLPYLAMLAGAGFVMWLYVVYVSVRQ